MADFATAVAKLRAAGVTTPPSPAQIQAMPGLSQDEKNILVQAYQTGALQQQFNSLSATQRQAQGSPTQAPPNSVMQKRDLSAQQQSSREWEDRAPIQSQPQQGVQPEKIPTAFDFGTNPNNTSSFSPVNNPNDNSFWDLDTPDLFNPASNRGITSILPASGMLPTPVRNASPGNLGSILFGGAGWPGITPTIPGVQNGSGVGSNGASPYDEPRVEWGNSPQSQMELPQNTSPYDEPRVEWGNQQGNNGAGSAGSLPDLPEAPGDYVPGAAPGLPDYSGIKLPTGIDFDFERRPFTKEGKEMAADVYAPLYKTLDNLRAAANNRYGRNKFTIGQLYQGLANDITAAKTKRDKEYDTDIAAQTVEGKAAAKDIASGYESSGKILADIMGAAQASDRTADNYGADVYAQQMAKSSGDAQAKATTRAQEQAGRMRSNKQIQDTYMTGVGDAYQTQGAVSQENLMRSLEGLMGEYGNQELAYNSQEADKALSIANLLSDRDWQSQQAEYGMLSDQYNRDWQNANWERQNINDAYGNRWNQYVQDENSRQLDWRNDWEVYNSALANRTELEKARIEAQNKLDLQAMEDAAAAGANGAEPLDPNDYAGAAKAEAMVKNWIMAGNGPFTDADIEQVMGYASGYLSGHMNDFLLAGTMGGGQHFADALVNEYRGKVPENILRLLRRAGDAYYTSMLASNSPVGQ